AGSQTEAPAATANAPAAETGGKPGKSKSGGTVMASLPSTNNPDELYRNSYQFILSGDYPTAEQGFRDHISRFPKDAKAADAHYWLGESLLGQQKYRDAAEVFLAASKDYPKAKKAPDMLLKLGVSLVGLKQNDVACATFNEIGKRYPDVSGTLKERIKQEKALASC
ncbi:tol-pal system protein YbgF, partial [Mesorhizobium sp.]